MLYKVRKKRELIGIVIRLGTIGDKIKSINIMQNILIITKKSNLTFTVLLLDTDRIRQIIPSTLGPFSLPPSCVDLHNFFQRNINTVETTLNVLFSLKADFCKFANEVEHIFLFTFWLFKVKHSWTLLLNFWFCIMNTKLNTSSKHQFYNQFYFLKNWFECYHWTI